MAGRRVSFREPEGGGAEEEPPLPRHSVSHVGGSRGGGHMGGGHVRSRGQGAGRGRQEGV